MELLRVDNPLRNQDICKENTPQGFLSVNEIFYSIQGEGKFSGTPMVFVRLNFCHVGCKFCDTKYTWKNLSHNKFLDAQGIQKEIVSLTDKCKHVCFTGGEPLEQQKTFIEVVKHLKSLSYKVHLETSGHYPIAQELVDDCFWIVCSPKRFNEENFLGRINEVKLVNDYRDKNGKEMEVQKNINNLRHFLKNFQRHSKVWICVQPVEPKPHVLGNFTGLKEEEVSIELLNIKNSRIAEEEEWKKNILRAVEICKQTGWQLSPQIQKYLNLR